MFKKFYINESISSKSQVKSSVARNIRKTILEQYPDFEKYADEVFPKKENVVVAKCQNHLELIIVNKEPIFYSYHDGPYLPTLKVLLRAPDMMKSVQVDKGAIKFVLSGANIMCRGLTSPGGRLPEGLAKGEPAIFAEGKENPLAVGELTMSSEEIREKNDGIGITLGHYLNDGLWQCNQIE
ncbi:hypothetical protein WA556_004630 [Blastocystis sp. ATCC 50177/Nand II]